MKLRTRAATLVSSAALVMGALTACDSATPAHHSDASRTPTTATSPTLPHQVLAVGKSVAVGGVTTTVEQVVRDFGKDRPAFQPDDPALEWLGVKARTCVSAHGKTAGPFGWYLFEAIDNSDGWYPALAWRDSSPLPSTEWPLPQYPPFSQLWAGQCAAGWLLIPVPRTASITKVSYSYAGVTRAAWLVE